MSRKTQDYANDFDPECFIRTYMDNSHNEKAKHLLLFSLDKFNDLFVSGNIKGHSLLDVGTGPTVHPIISASDHVTEIYLSDFNVENRRILSDWLKGKRDLDTFSFKYILEKQKCGLSVLEKQAKVRSCIKAVLQIDISKVHPFSNQNDVMKYDIITSRLCLESASHSLDEYRQCVKNIISLLKPGGFIVIAGILEASRYLNGKRVFRVQFVTRQDVINAVTAAGVQMLKFEEQEAEDDPNDDFKAMFIMLGKTKT